MWLGVQAREAGLCPPSECVHDAGWDIAVAAAEHKLIEGQMSTPAELVVDVAEHAGKAAAQLKPARQTVLRSGTANH